jgi:hypothetical protein
MAKFLLLEACACSNVRCAFEIRDPFALDGPIRQPRWPGGRAQAQKLMMNRQSSPLCLTAIMRSRGAAITISLAAVVQIVLVLSHLPGWPCPVLQATGIPCPGCGLTRAATALIQGNWSTAFSLHAFAPILLVSAFLIICSSFLPQPYRRGLISGVEVIERRTHVTSILAVGLIFYWLARLLFSPEAFIRMIKG